jgi:hypothetical protein
MYFVLYFINHHQIDKIINTLAPHCYHVVIGYIDLLTSFNSEYFPLLNHPLTLNNSTQPNLSRSEVLMPTASNATALLSLGQYADAPWGWESWTDITKISSPPWAQVDLTSAVGWTAVQVTMVVEYVRKFRGLEESEQAEFAKGKAQVKNRKRAAARKKAVGKRKGKGTSKTSSGAGTSTSGTPSTSVVASESDDSDAEAVLDAVDQGRKIWNDWATNQFKVWGINGIMDGVLWKKNKHPVQIMKMMKTKEVSYVFCANSVTLSRYHQYPSLQDAGVTNITTDFVDKFFGEDGYIDEECTLPKPFVTRFIDTVLANTWNRLRKWVKLDKSKLDKQRTVVEKAWNGASYI